MSVRTGAEAGAWFRAQVGKAIFSEHCKGFVRTGLNVVPSTSGTAIECYREAVHKHPTRDPESVPAFVPVFLNTSNVAEHVAFTVGRNAQGKRLVISTDAGPNHTIGLTTLEKLTSWGPIIGWVEDFDGQRIWTPPAPTPPAPKPTTAPLIHTHVVNRMNNDHEINLDEVSAIQLTGRQPYAVAANVLHDKVQAAFHAYLAATQK